MGASTRSIGMSLEDDFCDIIKKARCGQGLSLAEVARASGLPAGEVAMLERGGRKPTAHEVEVLAMALGLRTEPLLESVLGCWRPAPPPMEAAVETVVGDLNGYAVNGYVVYDAGEAVFVDTAGLGEAMLAALKRLGLRLKAICLTHGHADHAGGLAVVLQHHRVPVYLGWADKPLLGWIPTAGVLTPAEEGQALAVGRLLLHMIKTPGHTLGGTCYRLQGADHEVCFVGDTLFAGSIGWSNPASLYPVHLETVRTRLLTLPAHTLLLPGHGPATTVREERAHNPFAGSG
jgi:glyoxylase-like metal-dependent hydrolase (beta-lactamase superfamily II)